MNKDCLAAPAEGSADSASANAMSDKKLAYLAALAAVGLFVVSSLAQHLSPGEVGVRSGPYQPQPPILRAESRLVRIDAVVRDAKGNVLSGLKQSDFNILDDDKKQPISSFTIENRESKALSESASSTPVQAQPKLQSLHHRPRYVALYFDDLHTQPGDMRHLQIAAENFIRAGIAPSDQVGVFTGSSTVNVDFTSDTSKILDALTKLTSHNRVFDSGTCPRITGLDAYLIVNRLDPDAYDTAVAAAKVCNCDDQLNMDRTCYEQQERAVMIQAQQTWEPMRELAENTIETIQEVVNYLASKPGERVLVLGSSGFLSGSLERQIDNVIDSALRAGILINALDAKGLYTEDPGHGKVLEELPANGVAGYLEFRHEQEAFAPSLMSLTAAMADFAVGTGGRFFHNRNDLNAGYYSLAAAPEAEYLLGFVPGNKKSNGAYHKLKVEVNIPGKFYVQARPGYFAPAGESRTAASKPSLQDRLDVEVRESNERSDFPLTVAVMPFSGVNDEGLHVHTHVAIHKLAFKRHDDRYVDTLVFVETLCDISGKMIAGKEAEMQLALKPDTFARLSKEGIEGTMLLGAPPGNYRLRVVVQETGRGEISATTKTVQIP